MGLAKASPLSVAFQHIPGGWRRYIEYVDLAARKGDAAMEKVRDCYAALTPKDKANVWPEQLCDAANVSPGELVGAVCRNIWETKAAESSMVSAIAHPEMLMTTIKLAKKPDNFRDRELYFRMAGSLPDRKGASINIYNQAAGQPPNLPELGQAARMLGSIDDEVIEMSRDLELPDAPFMVKRDDVPSDDHQADD